MPRFGESILKFVNIALCCIQFNCTAREDNVADGVDARIGLASIDELSMVGALLLDEQFSDLAARVANSLEYKTTVLGDEVSSQCFPLEKSIGNVNLLPTATRLRDMLVPGTRQEFHA